MIFVIVISVNSSLSKTSHFFLKGVFQIPAGKRRNEKKTESVIEGLNT